MKPDANLVRIGALAIAAAPLPAMGLLVIIARAWKANLRPMLPWLHALRWVAWLIGMALGLAGLAFHQLFLWLGICICSASAGLGGIEGWVKQRYAPELLPPESPDGWWPTARQ